MEIKFGVYKADCYKMSKDEMEKMFLKSFDDYGEALKYAKQYSDETAIHLCEVKA